MSGGTPGIYTAIHVNGNRLSGQLNSTTLSLTATALEDTGFETIYRTYQADIASHTVAHAGWVDPRLAPALETILYNAARAAGTLVSVQLLTNAQPGNPCYSFVANQLDRFDPKGQPGQLAALDATWVVSGDMERGYTLFDGTLSATGGVASVDMLNTRQVDILQGTVSSGGTSLTILSSDNLLIGNTLHIDTEDGLIISAFPNTTTATISALGAGHTSQAPIYTTGGPSGAAYWQVETITGGTTGVTGTIEHSANNSTWSTLATFAGMTATGAQRLAWTANSKRFVRFNLTGLGGATSVKSLVALAVLGVTY